MAQSQTSKPVDPLRRKSIFSLLPRTFRDSNISLKSDNIEAIHQHMSSRALQNHGKYFEEAKAIIEGGLELLNTKEIFAASEKFENTKKELKRQRGKDPNQSNIPTTARKLRPKISRRKSNQHHVHSSQPENDALFSEETLPDNTENQRIPDVPQSVYPNCQSNENEVADTNKELRRQRGEDPNQPNIPATARQPRPKIPRRKSYRHHVHSSQPENDALFSQETLPDTTENQPMPDVPQSVTPNCQSNEKEVADILFSRVVGSPSELLHAIKSMTPRQKEVIADMGFESLLQIDIAKIPKALAFYVVNQLDTDALVIRTRNGEVPINREIVCTVYGFPMGNIVIEHLKSSNYNDATTTLWKKHLGDIGEVRPKDLVKTIKGSKSTGFMFKVDFLVLMVSTLVCAMKDGAVYHRFIKSLKPTSVIKEFDWCEFVVEAVKGCKENWRPHDNRHPFVGPLTFLVLLYCDHVRVAPEIERVRPVIVGWKSKDLKERQKSEICGGFALGELLHEADEDGGGEDNDNEQTEQEVVESVEKALVHVGKLICDAFSRFGDNEKLQSIKNKWDSAFSKQTI